MSDFMNQWKIVPGKNKSFQLFGVGEKTNFMVYTDPQEIKASELTASGLTGEQMLKAVYDAQKNKVRKYNVPTWADLGEKGEYADEKLITPAAEAGILISPLYYAPIVDLAPPEKMIKTILSELGEGPVLNQARFYLAPEFWDLELSVSNHPLLSDPNVKPWLQYLWIQGKLAQLVAGQRIIIGRKDLYAGSMGNVLANRCKYALQKAGSRGNNIMQGVELKYTDNKGTYLSLTTRDSRLRISEVANLLNGQPNQV